MPMPAFAPVLSPREAEADVEDDNDAGLGDDDDFREEALELDVVVDADEVVKGMDVGFGVSVVAAPVLATSTAVGNEVLDGSPGVGYVVVGTGTGEIAALVEASAAGSVVCTKHSQWRN